MVWAIVAGVIIYFMMLQDVFSFILEALAYQGTFVVGWVAIALVYIFMSRDQYGSDEVWKQKYLNVENFKVPAIFSWLVSSIVGVVLLQGSYAVWSAPVTAVLAATLYVVLMSRSKTVEEQVAVS